MNPEDSFTLTWCPKHKNWWVTNCPDCMVDANEEDIKQAGRKEVASWIGSNVVFAYDDAREAWQAQLKKWGIQF